MTIYRRGDVIHVEIAFSLAQGRSLPSVNPEVWLE
jgi:hypothetical protein